MRELNRPTFYNSIFADLQKNETMCALMSDIAITSFSLVNFVPISRFVTCFPKYVSNASSMMTDIQYQIFSRRTRIINQKKWLQCWTSVENYMTSTTDFKLNSFSARLSLSVSGLHSIVWAFSCLVQMHYTHWAENYVLFPNGKVYVWCKKVWLVLVV